MPRYVGTTDDEALDAFRRLTRTEGIIPALEPSHALARVDDLDAELILVCLSGRGDKDLAEVLARCRMSKTLAIYLMSGPDTPELAEAAVEGGADLVELGFPFSDPLADGPVIRRAAEKALAQGMRTQACLACLAAVRQRVEVPLVPMTYSSLLEAYGWDRFAADARSAGATSLIVADLPAGDRPSLRRVQLVAPTSTDERLRLAAGADGRLALPRHRDRHDGRSLGPVCVARGARRARTGRRTGRRALRRLRHFDARGRPCRRRAHRRRRRRLPRARSRRRTDRPRCAPTCARSGTRSTRLGRRA